MSEQISYRDPPPKIITFDCYGTLVQWYEVLSREIDVTLGKLAVTDVSATTIIGGLSAQGRRLTAEKPHRLYKDILGIGFTEAFAEHGLTPGKDEIERIASSPMKMGPHPEGAPEPVRQHAAQYQPFRRASSCLDWENKPLKHGSAVRILSRANRFRWA